MKNFVGVKIALFHGDKLIVFLRDNKEGIRFPGMWDFPGGGNENVETPLECIQREVREEFGIKLEPEQVFWQKEFPAMHDDSLRAYFMVGKVSEEQMQHVVFTEGQQWQLMAPEEFLAREDVVPKLKTRLLDYLNSRPS